MKNNIISQLIISISSFVFGILFIVFPNAIIDVLFYILGGIIILAGVANLIYTLVKYNKELSLHKSTLITDAVIIVIGILFESLAKFFIFFLLLVLGILFIALGAYGIYSANVNPTFSKKDKIYKTVFGTLNVIIGIMLLVNINRTFNVIMYILGALLLVNGIVEFSNFIQGSKKEKALSKENKQKEKDIIDVEASESEE